MQQPPSNQPPQGDWQPTPGGGWRQPAEQQPPPAGWGQAPQGTPQEGSYGGGYGYEPPPAPPDRGWMVWGAVVGGGMFCLLAVLSVICVVTLTTGEDDADPTAVADTSAPTVRIVEPASGEVFGVGDTITVQAVAEDTGSGVTRVELLVNNVIVDSQISQDPTGQASLTVLLDYTPAVPSPTLTLRVRAYRGRGTEAISEDATLNVTVTDDDLPATATPATGGVTAGPTAIPPTLDPRCRARVDVAALNFREGPAVDYEVIRSFQLGNEPLVVGRLGDNSWWQVTSAERQGWVSAAFTTLLGNCANIPVATPPVSPTPSPTATEAGPALPNLQVATLAGANEIVLTGGQVSAVYLLRVENTGGGAASAPFNVTITYPSGEVTDFTVEALAPEEAVEIPNVNASFTSPGTYRLAVLVDSSGNIEESNENDNTAFLDITVSEPTPTPAGQ
ncbi:MAG: Ig-like domain-containing protein [Anaerolineales bacterium]